MVETVLTLRHKRYTPDERRYVGALLWGGESVHKAAESLKRTPWDVAEFAQREFLSNAWICELQRAAYLRRPAKPRKRVLTPNGRRIRREPQPVKQCEARFSPSLDSRLGLAIVKQAMDDLFDPRPWDLRKVRQIHSDAAASRLLLFSNRKAWRNRLADICDGAGLDPDAVRDAAKRKCAEIGRELDKIAAACA